MEWTAVILVAHHLTAYIIPLPCHNHKHIIILSDANIIDLNSMSIRIEGGKSRGVSVGFESTDEEEGRHCGGCMLDPWTPAIMNVLFLHMLAHVPLLMLRVLIKSSLASKLLPLTSDLSIPSFIIFLSQS